MFKFTAVANLIALLCIVLGVVDARIIALGVPTVDNAIQRSTLVQRDVISPPITYPTTGTVWEVGSRHNVTWDTSVIPPGTKSNGMLVLGYLDPADGTNEHLQLDNPLAKNFPITDGRAEITVPSVTTRDSYIIVLFGDSGNASNKFTIKNIRIASLSSSSSTASASVALSSHSPSASSSTNDPNAPSTSRADPSPPPAATVVGAAITSTVPTLQSSSAGSSSTQRIVSQSAGVSTNSAPSNAAYRSMAFGGSAIRFSVTCMLGVMLRAAI